MQRCAIPLWYYKAKPFIGILIQQSLLFCHPLHLPLLDPPNYPHKSLEEVHSPNPLDDCIGLIHILEKFAHWTTMDLFSISVGLSSSAHLNWRNFPIFDVVAITQSLVSLSIV